MNPAERKSAFDIINSATDDLLKKRRLEASSHSYLHSQTKRVQSSCFSGYNRLGGFSSFVGTEKHSFSAHFKTSLTGPCPLNVKTANFNDGNQLMPDGRYLPAGFLPNMVETRSCVADSAGTCPNVSNVGLISTETSTCTQIIPNLAFSHRLAKTSPGPCRNTFNPSTFNDIRCTPQGNSEYCPIPEPEEHSCVAAPTITPNTWRNSKVLYESGRFDVLPIHVPAGTCRKTKQCLQGCCKRPDFRTPPLDSYKSKAKEDSMRDLCAAVEDVDIYDSDNYDDDEESSGSDSDDDMYDEITTGDNVQKTPNVIDIQMDSEMETDTEMPTLRELTDSEPDDEPLDNYLKRQQTKRVGKVTSATGCHKSLRPKKERAPYVSIRTLRNLSNLSIRTATLVSCKCGGIEGSCGMGITEDDVRDMRKDYWKKSSREQFMWLCDKLARWGSFPENEPPTFEYRFAGKTVCSKAFSEMLPVSLKQLARVRKTVVDEVELSEKGLPRVRSPVTSKRLHLMTWLRKYFDDYGTHMPDKNQTHLSPCTTKESVYISFMTHIIHDEMFQYKISKGYFYRVWKAEFYPVKCPKVCKFSQCSECQQIKSDMAALPTNAERVHYRKLYREHLENVAKERAKYHKHMEKGSRWGKWASIIIDGMTQNTTMLPHFLRRPHWAKVKDTEVNVHVMGTLIGGVGSLLEFSYGGNLSNDGNSSISSMHRAIDHIFKSYAEKNLPPPTVLYVQLDNCSANKCNAMKAYAGWLVSTGMFEKVKFNYLPVGHTHENIDQLFSRFSVALKKKDAFTMKELMRIGSECYSPAPICYYVPNNVDWTAFLIYNRTPAELWSNISFNYQFKIFKADTGKVWLQGKRYSYSEVWLPYPGIEVLPRIPVGEPDFVLARAFDEDALRRLRYIIKHMPKHVSIRFTKARKEYWDDLLEHQLYLADADNGQECTEAMYLRANPTLVKPNGVCKPPPPAPMPSEDYVDAFRGEERPLHAGACEELKNREADKFKKIAKYEIHYSELFVGTIVLLLSKPTKRDMCHFHLRDNSGVYSEQYLALVVVKSLIPNMNAVTGGPVLPGVEWEYFRINKGFTDSKDRTINRAKAATRLCFVPSGHKELAAFIKEETIISWDPEEGDVKGAIDLKVYDKACLVLRSMHRAREKEMMEENAKAKKQSASVSVVPPKKK